MKNSAQWFNLYSVESKYSIQVCRSITQRLLIIGCLGLAGCLAVIMLLSESNILLAQIIVIPMIVLLVVIVSIIYAKNKTLGLNGTSVMLFDLSTEGDVIFPDAKKYRLHINSRVGILGCWLLLESQSHERISNKHFFIFKDSVTALSYSRICRTINRHAASKSKRIEA